MEEGEGWGLLCSLPSFPPEILREIWHIPDIRKSLNVPCYSFTLLLLSLDSSTLTQLCPDLPSCREGERTVRHVLS